MRLIESYFPVSYGILRVNDLQNVSSIIFVIRNGLRWRDSPAAQNHIGIDWAHGLIRTWDASAANAHDGARLPELISKQNSGSGVWADPANRSKKNEAFLEYGMLKNHIHQLRMPRRPLPEHIVRANAKRSAVRYPVEHVFAGQTRGMGLFICTGGIASAKITISRSSLS